MYLSNFWSLSGLAGGLPLLINLIGNYQFNINPNIGWVEKLLSEWDWQKDIDLVEKKLKKNQ